MSYLFLERGQRKFLPEIASKLPERTFGSQVPTSVSQNSTGHMEGEMFLRARVCRASATHLAYPVGHDVGAGGAVVCIDDDDGDDDGRDDKHHGEQHVFPNQGHGTGGGRDQLHDDQEKHG